MEGKVYLVGAGPGDPKLITVRGLECLRAADVVVYDRLVSPELLEQCRPEAERIWAGKASGHHALPQEEINALLVRHAREGKTVCRLKGGDPFLFGRGGEEVEALAVAGIPFEVVPGVTAGLGASAYAGIPLTHRDFAASVAFVTGCRKRLEPGETATEVNWQALAAGVDTLVFYMGVNTLPSIVEQLLAGGKAPETPVAVIQEGTTLHQETVTGTLADIAERVREHGIHPPALIVVGEVVRLRERLAWFGAK